ncbi:MAG: calcium-binding protein, partial [Roseomonas sp.]|nr:calcium-binding protein [Roseomonas sp.]
MLRPLNTQGIATSGSTGSVVNAGDGNDPVIGSNGADTLDGGNGNDTIGGFAGNDSILGGLGDDRIDGGDDADIALGGLGDDLVQGGNGDDHLSGEDGADTLAGGSGADTLLGGAHNDSLSGGNGNDSILGGDGADTLIAGGLVDTLSGDAGNDLYLVAGMDNGRIIDSSGNDTVSMLGGGVDTTSASAGDLSGAAGIEAIDLAGSGHVLGLTAASVLALSDTDVLRVYGSGNDVLLFEDLGWIRGTNSGGLVTYTNGAATVMASEGIAPTLIFGATGGDDALSGGIGADAIDLLGGNDSYLGLDGNDTIQGNEGNDSLSGGNDADSILGDAGNDSLFGNSGNDIVLGGDGADTIYGGNGDDSIVAGAGNDRLFGEAGNDTIDAGAGTNDRILYSHTGGPALTATVNNDGSSSGVNRATVTSAEGTDSILGFEILSGSNAADQITVQTAATVNTNLLIFGNIGNDTIIDNYGQGGVFADYNSSIVTLTGVSVNLAAGVASDGANGTDSLIGITAVNASSFADTLIGGNGNDRFRGWEGNDLIDGGNGSQDLADYFYLSASSQAITVDLVAGRANDGMGGTDTLIS